jgi:hypothetical protein
MHPTALLLLSQRNGFSLQAAHYSTITVAATADTVAAITTTMRTCQGSLVLL